MPARRRTWMVAAGVLGLAIVAGIVVGGLGGRRHTTPGSDVTFDAKTPLATLAPALRESDARALSALTQRLSPKPDAPASATTEAEAQQWVEILTNLRGGYPGFGGHGRTIALSAAMKILDRFAVEPAPASWMKALPPLHDILSAGMADRDLMVRAAALTEVSRIWAWLPGRTPTAAEENSLAAWKEGLYAPVLRGVADRSTAVRTAAVACLGNVPIDNAAAPAIPYLEDMSQGSGDVRRQVLISFARRRALLSEDAILKRLYDPEPAVAEIAEIVLKTRGLTAEQISLGRMIYHPKPELRASVIPLLRDRTDIDPVIWLLELSRDSDESVRASAVEALAGRLSPEVRRRLAEMAQFDQSPVVRQAASKIVPPASEKTAALPPLPGSPSLNPKAN
jgi:hypothetical protein